MELNQALESFLRTIPLFSLVEPPEMVDLLQVIRPVALEAGAVLFRQGVASDAMWVLGEGAQVAISATPNGEQRPVLLARIGAGETVGEMALVDEGGHSGTAVVTQGGPAHLIGAAEFLALRRAWAPAAFKVLRRICVDLCARLRATSDRIAPSGGGAPTPVPPPSRAASPELLDEFGPFRKLPQVVKLALAQQMTVVEADGVLPIFAEGDPADAAYFVISGEVTVGRAGRTLAVSRPGDTFGVVSVIDGSPRSASCVTSGPAKLLRLAKGDFDALFARGNRFAFQVVDFVARDLVGRLRNANALLLASARAAQVVTQQGAPADPIDVPLELELELELELQL